MGRPIPSRIGFLAAGIAITALVQLVAPVRAPLFDGVVVSDPYRYVVPPSGEAGSPTSANETVAVDTDVSPAFAVFTDETPPQAELLAHGGELALRSDTRSIRATIKPMAPATSGALANVAGNVYRFAVTDQADAALALRAGETITLAMRGPAGISANAQIARLENGAWHALSTGPSGLQDFLITNITDFGDFAILGSLTPAPGDESPALLIAAIVVAAVIGFFGLRLDIPRRRRAAATEAKRGRRAPGTSRAPRPKRGGNEQDRR